jgi:hypothetical protein
LTVYCISVVVNELSDVNPLLGIKEILLKKKISIREHYDLEDRNRMKLGEADGNLFSSAEKTANPGCNKASRKGSLGSRNANRAEKCKKVGIVVLLAVNMRGSKEQYIHDNYATGRSNCSSSQRSPTT